MACKACNDTGEVESGDGIHRRMDICLECERPDPVPPKTFCGECGEPGGKCICYGDPAPPKVEPPFVTNADIQDIFDASRSDLGRVAVENVRKVITGIVERIMRLAAHTKGPRSKTNLELASLVFDALHELTHHRGNHCLDAAETAVVNFRRDVIALKNRATAMAEEEEHLSHYDSDEARRGEQ